MIRYKGMYCPILQYMPNKLQKWGLKVWCLACSTSKYVWNFEVYCGKENVEVENPIGMANPMFIKYGEGSQN